MKLPPEFAAAHPGPQFGIAGSRALTGVKERPIIGSIVKPALGLRPQETAAMVRELVDADVDFIKDDEKLMSPAYSNLADHSRSRTEDRQEGDVRFWDFARRSRSHASQSRHRRRRRWQCRGHQHQLDRLRRFLVLAQALAPGSARSPQWLGHSHASSRPRAGFSRLSAVLAPAGRRPVPDQRRRRQILGTRRVLRAVVPGPSATLVRAERSAIAGGGIGPMGRPGA